ncbi:hypothetical protein Phi19:2_gp048 [Cellulophaga phage phi19:2]|uniref:Transmembrane protein n=2 Tax=Cellulophaga phage phiST TaxID=756282 RepID=M4SNA3_9CAUD|nr:hypothetical protein CGPG_00061 [Cellulophaga phage phiST]AGH56760.1 hypothetical protein CGPG_00061 [Cellulophaga phage phiST]AGO47187.1 hypothetical protein PhiST_gp048 [Cellulophaga phage phiST]AGO48683.1 hypothetical protein Phi19:2_gp048 [Cellulophaga phage phi19:2]
MKQELFQTNQIFIFILISWFIVGASCYALSWIEIHRRTNKPIDPKQLFQQSLFYSGLGFFMVIITIIFFYQNRR